MSHKFLTLNTAAASQPVTATEAKAHLRVDGTDEDTLISSLIEAATRAVEEETGKAFITQTWDFKMAEPSGRVRLPMAPVSSISAMSYYDTDDNSQSLTTSDFYLFSDNDRAWAEPKDGVSWPSMQDRMDALTITFIAGYGAASAVPTEIKQAILLLIGHWFSNRDALGDMKQLPLAYQYLTAQYRVGWFA